MPYIKYSSRPLSGSPSPAKRSVHSAAGFSFLELIFVVLIISVILIKAVPSYQEAKQLAQTAVIDDISTQFSSVVAMLHGKGVAKRSLGETAKHQVVEVETRKVYLNEYGWPANTTPRFDAALANQTAYECQQLWYTVLQNPPSVAIEGEKMRGKAYLISKSDKEPRCRYTLITNTPDSHYFEYNLMTGQVFVTKP